MGSTCNCAYVTCTSKGREGKYHQACDDVQNFAFLITVFNSVYLNRVVASMSLSSL